MNLGQVIFWQEHFIGDAVCVLFIALCQEAHNVRMSHICGAV